MHLPKAPIYGAWEYWESGDFEVVPIRRRPLRFLPTAQAADDGQID